VPPADAVRIFHFADVHLGVETHGKYNPETGLNTRLEDFTLSLNAAVDRALEANVDLALFAGDAYKARDPNQTHQRAFASALKRLVEADVPVAMLIGNHDIPNTRGRAHALEIYGLLGGAGVTLFPRPLAQPIQTRRGEVIVAGMPYLIRSNVLAQDAAKGKTVEEVAALIRDRYSDYVSELAAQCQREFPEHLCVLMGHFTVADARVGVQGFLLNPSEPQVPASALAIAPFSYVALGHVHKFQELNRGAQPPVVYSGSIDRVDFGERKEDKGFVLAEVARDQPTTWEHVPLKTRPFLELDLDAGDSDEPTETLLAELQKTDVTDAIVRVRYRVSAEHAALVRIEDLKKALSTAQNVVALSRELPTSEALIRSQGLTETLTPEVALEKYIESQPRLTPRKEELLQAARALFDELTRLEDAA
jgi:DNA repair protein SbcD/Mre11